jgi:hypothetical protein
MSAHPDSGPSVNVEFPIGHDHSALLFAGRRPRLPVTRAATNGGWCRCEVAALRSGLQRVEWCKGNRADAGFVVIESPANALTASSEMRRGGIT